MFSAVEGAVDQFGMPIALGAGGAYLAGAVPAAGVAIAGTAVAGAAKDEFTSDQLRVLGEYGPQDQVRYDRMMAQIGARKGTGTGGAMSVFGLLMSGGLDAESAAASTEAAVIFAKATQASPEDAANTTIALKNTFGIGTDGIMGAYDAMAIGGKAGQFEVRDMAKSFPSIASKMASLGENGMDGTRLLVALGQQIRKTAGSSDKAATNFENMLGKFRAQDFLKNADEIGIDAEAVRKAAIADGKSPVMALLEEIRSKVGTDGTQLAKLMPDVESLAALEASLKGLDDAKKLLSDMQGSPGKVMEDFAVATDNASSAFDRFTANVAAKAKFLAAYALPPLTAAMNAASNLMEGDGEPDQVKAPDGTSASTQQAISAANDRGARINRFLENLFGWDNSNASKELDVTDAYQQYATTRMQGERGAPTAMQRFLYGAAAEPNFDLKTTMGVDLKGTAEQSMGGFTEGLTAEGEKAKAEASGIADYIKSILGFTVSPTIAPTFVPPPSAGSFVPASEKHSSLQNSSSLNLTQNISTPNPKLAALKARRDQARAIQQAKARSLHDVGRGLA